MISKVTLAPFGGCGLREVCFNDGLNVILGANEAGKSTLVNAIFAALFVPVDIRKSAPLYKEYIERYMPYGGGDTISVSVDFTVDGHNYALTRSWGEGRSCRLVLTNGAVMTNEHNIQEKLASLLGLGRGTYEGVFFARQEDMVKTVELLRRNTEAANTLGDVLRAALIQAGGISLDALAVAISDAKQELLSNWDQEKDAPKNNRGIGNPYVKNVGRLLEAYYTLERLKKSLRTASEAETNVEKAYANLEAAAGEKAAVTPQKAALEAIENDIYQRARLEPEAAKVQMMEEKLKGINKEWPQAAERLIHLEKALAADRKRLAVLTTEMQAAKDAQEARKRLERFQAVKPLVDELESIQNQLADLPAICKEDVEWLEHAQKEIANLETEIKAMSLTAKFSSKEPMTITVESALGGRQTLHVADETAVNGEGRLLISTDTWTLQVQAGQTDVQSILSAIDHKKTAVLKKLNQLGMKDTVQAGQVLTQRRMLQQKAEQLQAQMAGTLLDETYDQLAAAASNLTAAMTRDTETVLAELVQVKSDIQRAEEQAEEIRLKLSVWETEYGTSDAVVDKLVELRGQLQQIQSQLSKLAPLPDDFSDTDQFFSALKMLREKNSRIDEAISAGRQELMEAQAQLGEETAEEIAVRLSEAQTQFDRLKRKASSLVLVEDEFNRLAADIDKHSFSPFMDAFCRYLAPATAYRYDTAQLTGALPSHIVRKDGRQLPVELLSTGTTRGIALALRLAMAEFLMREYGGFLVMDDPLVDLDPVRKEHAAAMIKDFSTDKQIIITTCDPDTAERLGGHVFGLS